ncbi:MAG: YfcE family phosphodiesterase [Myxococcaceae bacterium]|nr:YfcE family phosphodiesterase [Myxococcaceae bacterium]
MTATGRVQLGVVSDTHDRFDPALQKLFAGVDFILHAGDIVGPEVLEALGAIAPVRAVRGNNDLGAWADLLPAARVERFLEVPVLLVHILGSVAQPTLAVQFLLEAEKPRVVISGHSHQPLLEVRDRILFFNPGSAGPGRFKLKPAAGLLTVQPGRVHGELYALEAGEARKQGEQQLDLL